MKRLFLILALLVAPVSFAQTLIVSQTTGSYNWSNTAAWVGGVVPTDGDFSVWKSTGTLTIDENVGSTGIYTFRQEAGTIHCTPGITIKFGSTGTNPVGSGTATNPGADATEMGFFISKGTFDCEGTSGSDVTITSANGTSPVYVHHQWGDFIGCTTFTANVCNGALAYNTVLGTMKHVSIGPAVGTATTGYEGIRWDYSSGTDTLNLSFNQITGLNQIAVVQTPPASGFVISNNSFVNPTNAITITASYAFTNGATVTNNTEQGSTTAGYFFNPVSGSTGLVFTGNAELGTSTVTRGLLKDAPAAGSGRTITGNICYDPLNASIPTNVFCIIYSGALTDLTTIIENNVLIGSYCQVDLGSGSPLISGNWLVGHSDAAAGQCPIFTPGVAFQSASNTYTIQNNILSLDSCGINPLLSDLYTANATLADSNIELVKNNTLSGCSADTGLYMAEGNATTTNSILNSVLRNNIKVNGVYGFVDGNDNSTWSTVNQVNSSGVHHNLTFNQSTSAYENGGTAWSVGFDDGTHHHPNALYGDLTVNPNFINPTATPAQFDSFCGGPGTVADLFTNLSYQSTFGGTYNANCSIANMLAWLQYQFTPMNSQLKNAGAPSDCPASCDVGSQPVYPATAMNIL